MRQVDFDISMGKNDSYDFEIFSLTSSNKKRYKFFKQLFKRNFNTDNNTSVLLIPKIIHQIWLGPNEIPKAFESFMKNWKDKHPEWEYKLWTDQNLNSFKFNFLKDYFDKSNNYGQKADLLRLEILYQYGGLYVDVDFECLESFEDMNHKYHFYCGIHPPHKIITPSYPLEIGNALIGSTAEHPIILKTIEFIIQRWNKIYTRKERDDNWRIVLSTWYPLRDGIMTAAYKQNLRNIALPSSYFYPILLEKTRAIGKQKIENAFTAIKEETMAIHHWGETWFNKFIK